MSVMIYVVNRGQRNILATGLALAALRIAFPPSIPISWEHTTFGYLVAHNPTIWTGNFRAKIEIAKLVIQLISLSLGFLALYVAYGSPKRGPWQTPPAHTEPQTGAETMNT